jgi:DNA-binding GntR family transcriptional regulator
VKAAGEAADASVASARIAGELRAEILAGRLRPGERIRQEDLAARSGASRIPVREALRELAAEGLVTLVANSGAWVARMTMAECDEAYQVRERLEPLLLRLSLPRLGAAVPGRLAGLAAEMEAAPGVDAFLRADREFHLAGYAGAAGGEAWQVITRLWNATQHYRREFTLLAAGAGNGALGERLGVTHLEHRLLADAISRGDADDAERALVTHIRRTRLGLRRHPEAFAGPGQATPPA